MSIGSPSSDGVRARDAHARAVAVDSCISSRLRHATHDLFLPQEARLSDRSRAAVHNLLSRIVGAIEAEVRSHAARLLARTHPGQAEVLANGAPVLNRLKEAGAFRSPDLVEDLVARVELDLLDQALQPAVADSGRPGLLARLAGCPDGIVATATRALLGAESRRRSAIEGSGPVRSELPAELHQRLVWMVAAGIREQSPGLEGMADRDRALTEAGLRSLNSHDEADRLEVAATRLASAIDAQPDELGPLLTDTVADRRVVLFVALVARAGGVEYEQVRHLVVDPRADLLLILLRAIGLERADIARIGVALAEADPQRDLEQLADAIDWALAHDRGAARAALAPLSLCRDFRIAVRALARRP